MIPTPARLNKHICICGKRRGSYSSKAKAESAYQYNLLSQSMCKCDLTRTRIPHLWLLVGFSSLPRPSGLKNTYGVLCYKLWLVIRRLNTPRCYPDVRARCDLLLCPTTVSPGLTLVIFKNYAGSNCNWVILAVTYCSCRLGHCSFLTTSGPADWTEQKYPTCAIWAP